MKRLYYLDKLGWPVERIKGRWFLNFLRILIHTRRITFKAFGRDTSIEGFHKLLDKLGILSIDEVKDFMQDVEEYWRNTFVLKCCGTGSRVTQEAIEKSECGEDVKTVDTVEELFEDLNDEIDQVQVKAILDKSDEEVRKTI